MSPLEPTTRTAVEQERARIQRDLHDLLGQNLFLIALHGEVASRQIAADQQGGTNVRDIVRLAREAMRNLRQVVSGGLQPTLEAELVAARAGLEAAGIHLDLQQSLGEVCGETLAVLAWTVREGVTNVIRHSRASRCRIVLAREGACVRLDIMDDGKESGASGSGTGLRGLRARLAAVGGCLSAAPIPGRGFRLTVVAPAEVGASAQFAQQA